MRIIAGSLGGRRIEAPAGRATRPTSELVRGAMFNSLDAHVGIAGASVADLFAGSGALGIEALSRGARSAVFVESDRNVARVIEANLHALGCEATVLTTTAESWAAHGDAEIVLADPPYGWDGWPDLLDALDNATCVVAEADHEISHPGWEVVVARRHGGTVVTLLEPRHAQGART